MIAPFRGPKNAVHLTLENMNADTYYKRVKAICEKSQRLLESRNAEVGGIVALSDIEPYEGLWKELEALVPEPQTLEGKGFAGLLFKNARFSGHRFLGCDFRKTRWVFSVIRNCEFGRSDFSEMTANLGFPFESCRFSGCKFRDADIGMFAPFASNDFTEADFTNARIESSYSFFESGKPDRPALSCFRGATMMGCTLSIKPEKASPLPEDAVRRVLEQIFDPDQRAAMRIDLTGQMFPRAARPGTGATAGKSGCFIATAACGTAAHEDVVALQQFRDRALRPTPVGRSLITIYEVLSPPMARVVAEYAFLQRITRKLVVRPAAALVRGWIGRDA